MKGIIEFPKFLSVRSKDIIRKLLNPDVTKRLGVKDVKNSKEIFKDGVSIMEHKFFRGVPW